MIFFTLIAETILVIVAWCVIGLLAIYPFKAFCDKKKLGFDEADYVFFIMVWPIAILAMAVLSILYALDLVFKGIFCGVSKVFRPIIKLDKVSVKN